VSTIPISSGLGSGASVASAIALLLGQVLCFDYAQINEFVFFMPEKHFHGQPSGIDNTVNRLPKASLLSAKPTHDIH
jgi:mevalonate kinase